jgi:hypothetical protein
MWKIGQWRHERFWLRLREEPAMCGWRGIARVQFGHEEAAPSLKWEFGIATVQEVDREVQ